MKNVVDNQIVKAFFGSASCITKDELILDKEHSFDLRWPSFLELLELGNLFTSLPLFNPSSAHYQTCLKILHSHQTNQELFDLFDGLFVENLTQIKALPEIQLTFLIEAIKKRKERLTEIECGKVLHSLLRYEKELFNNSSNTLHDLVLYLAWDRVCVAMNRLFDHQSTELNFLQGLVVLKECLVESFQHISNQKRTNPSVYRLFESLFFYYMRQENLYQHTPEEWNIFSQAFQIIKDLEKLTDIFYIDDAIINADFLKEDLFKSETNKIYFTLDSEIHIQQRLAFAHAMNNKLKSEILQWDYVLIPTEIRSIKKCY